MAFECTTADENAPALRPSLWLNKIGACNARPILRLLDVARRILAAVDPGRGAVVGSKDPCPGGRAAETVLSCEACFPP